MAGRERPRRHLLAAHHQPGRGPPAARPPGRPQRRPARRRRRRPVARRRRAAPLPAPPPVRGHRRPGLRAAAARHGLRHGRARRRERRRNRRRLPAGHGPVLLPRPGHRRQAPHVGRPVHGQARQAAQQAHDLPDGPGDRQGHPPAQSRSQADGRGTGHRPRGDRRGTAQGLGRPDHHRRAPGPQRRPRRGQGLRRTLGSPPRADRRGQGPGRTDRRRRSAATAKRLGDLGPVPGDPPGPARRRHPRRHHRGGHAGHLRHRRRGGRPGEPGTGPDGRQLPRDPRIRRAVHPPQAEHACAGPPSATSTSKNR